MLLYSLLLVIGASAHFQMARPEPRTVGTMDTQGVFPCAGDPNPSPIRIPYGNLNNSIELAFFWDGDNEIFMGLGENATKFPFKIGQLKGAKMGQSYTVPLDLSSVKGWTDGVPATIQVICHQPDFDIYQCVDVVNKPADGKVGTKDLPIQEKGMKFTESIVSHISGPNGCNVNTDDLTEEALSNNLAALWLRASFHDVGKWMPGSGVASGLLADRLAHPENLGIGKSLATFFSPKSLFQFSSSDLVAAAAQVTLQHCGGPKFNFTFGRKDSELASMAEFLPIIPDDRNDTYSEIKFKLGRLGFTNQDIVALVTGSHSLGGVHGKISPHITNSAFIPFDSTPGVFDNDVFKALLDGKCRLRVDCGIAKDPELLPYVKLYANDQDAFFKQYAISFQKMVSIGHDQVLQSVHIDVPVHENLMAEGSRAPILDKVR